MIILYDKNTTDFNNNGIGILKEVISCEVEEELNGLYILNMDYMLKGKYADYLIEDNIIKCDTDYDNQQLFRIKKTEENFDTLTIYAEHITYDLADNMLLDTFPQNLNGGSALNWILQHTQYDHNFTCISDITKVASARYVRLNPIQAVIGDIDNSFVKIWGGELLRDNYTINMLNKRGKDNGYKIKYGKNLTGLQYTIDKTSLVTRILALGYDGIMLPEKFIDSEYINNYPHPLIQKIEFSDIKLKEKSEDEEGFDTLEEVYEEMRKRCKELYTVSNIDKPTINVKVEFVEVERYYKDKYKWLERLKLGDIVTIELEKISIKLRVIKTKYDSTLSNFISLELGEFSENFIKENIKEVNTIKDTINNFDSTILEKASYEATQLITNALGGYILKTQSELFILDNPDINLAKKLWRWNINGLGYSSTGINGTYGLAMTMDGSINASFIKSGNISADRIYGGTLILGGNNNIAGSLIIKDSLANDLIKLNNFGITLANGAKLIGGNGVLSNFKFDTGYWQKIGYTYNPFVSGLSKAIIKIPVYIPLNFEILEAKLLFRHAPTYWDSELEVNRTWGTIRNLKLYKETNSNNYYNVAVLNSEGFENSNSNYLEIAAAFGENGFTAKVPTSPPSYNPVNTVENVLSIDIKNYLNVGNYTYLSLMTSNDIPDFVENNIEKNMLSQTGIGMAILNIIGYMK